MVKKTFKIQPRLQTFLAFATQRTADKDIGAPGERWRQQNLRGRIGGLTLGWQFYRFDSGSNILRKRRRSSLISLVFLRLLGGAKDEMRKFYD